MRRQSNQYFDVPQPPLSIYGTGFVSWMGCDLVSRATIEDRSKPDHDPKLPIPIL